MIWLLQHQSVENDNSLSGCAQYGYSIPTHYIRSYYNKNKTNKCRRTDGPSAAVRRILYIRICDISN